MKTEQNDIIRAAKIIGACILVASGGLGLFLAYPVGRFDQSRATPVAYLLLFLGVWLLIGAWTGRTVLDRLRSLYRAIAADPREPSPEPAPSSPKETGNA
jgi:hypothetical protein